MDCGGPCVPCALREQKPIDVFWARFVQIRENTYDVAAEIRNPNVRLGATSFDYEFKLYDTAGVNVVSRRGRSFLYPGETMHLVEIGLLSGRTVRNASLTIGDTVWVLSDAIGPDIIAGSKEYATEGGSDRSTSLVKAIVANRGTRDITNIHISAVVFDGDGNLLGAHRTVLNALDAGSSKSVEFAWPTEFASPPASLVVEARSAALLPGTRP